jgi:puromycin-sensitive aminopeptidase
MNLKRVAAAAAGFCAIGFVVAVIVGQSQRLPHTVVPEHYDLHLTPDLSTSTFTGEASIDVSVVQPTNAVVLNAVDIDFASITVTAAGATQTAAVTLDADRQTATLSVSRELPAGPATIRIRYTGKLNNQLRGFYLSRSNGRTYATTQMEPTDARRAFPCFDEPALKATFSISATIDQRDTAISNGRIVSDTPGPAAGTHTLKFSTSPKMSTYTVALAVGDWACVSGSADDIPIRVCATPDKKDQLGFALQAAEFAMRYFNRYFTIKYPYEKLDLLGVPDFSAGAMENTGAIIFRERLLLVDENTASSANRKRVSDVINHEMAHQWFGDLVTMKWWDDIWLNEGFATWMERKPIAEWHPEWNPQIDEIRDTQSAMNTDALSTTRAIRTPVETPDEIDQIFDSIAYQKTGAVVRMVEAYVGAENYRAAVNAYLRKFAYGNADGEGYWTTIAQTTGKPVDRILESYITQKSMPLVGVKSRCANGKTEIELTQRPISVSAPASTTWQIPVCLKRSTGGRLEPTACELLSKPVQTVSLAGCSPWVFANANGLGYYRTSYTTNDLDALGAALRTGGLTPAEQTLLVEDMWELVRLNQQSIAGLLSLSNQIFHARLSPSISAATNHIDYIADHLVDAPDRTAFEQFVRTTLRPLLNDLGYVPGPQDSDERRTVRSDVLYTLGYAGRDPDVLKEARRRIDMHLGNAGAIDPSLLTAYLQLAAINGDQKLYGQYVDQLRRSNQARQFQYRAALPYFADPDLRRRTLELSTSSDIRSQDLPQVLNGLLARPTSSHDTWEYIKMHWGELQSPLGFFQGVPSVAGATQNFCDQPTRDDVQQFFEGHRSRAIDRAVKQSLATMDRCIALKAQQQESLAAFLQSSGSGSLR